MSRAKTFGLRAASSIRETRVYLARKPSSAISELAAKHTAEHLNGKEELLLDGIHRA